MSRHWALGFTYDASNQPTAVSGSAAASYVYDGNLKRVKSTEGGQVTYSVYSSLTGKISIIDKPAGDRITLLNLGPVSIRVPASGTPVYTHLDHLGSPVAATNTAGNILWREGYNPYGGKRIDPVANEDKPGFTGHVDDDATGLTYMQARYYSPVLGRFLSNDPVGFTPARPEMLNRYAYAANDPVNMWDPHGLDVKTDGDCLSSCRVYDEEKRVITGSRIPRTVRTELGTYSAAEGLNVDPMDEGTTPTNNPINGTLHYMAGSGTPGRENINTRRMHTYAAKRLGESVLSDGGSVDQLVRAGGGSMANFAYAGNTGDWTAGSVQFRGGLNVDVRGGIFSASGYVTAQDELYDFNSNPGRGAFGNMGVLGSNIIIEGFTHGQASPFRQTYFGTIHFNFTGAVR